MTQRSDNSNTAQPTEKNEVFDSIMKTAERTGGVSWALLVAAFSELSPLVGEDWLKCPRCGHRDHPSAYRRLQLSESYRNYLAPIFQCEQQGCFHRFAPVNGALLDGL